MYKHRVFLQLFCVFGFLLFSFFFARDTTTFFYSPAERVFTRIHESLSKGCQYLSFELFSFHFHPKTLESPVEKKDDPFKKIATTVDIASQLQTIPREDQQMLEYFFRTLISRQGFGYTLFGEKPMTTWEWLKDPEIEKIRPYFSVTERYVHSYHVWKKYRHQFPSEKFLFDECILLGKWISIYLVNEEAFEKTVKRYRSIFHKNSTASSFAAPKQIFIQKKWAFYRKTYHVQMGILYGYGHDNVIEFAKKVQEQIKNDSEYWIPFVDYEFYPKRKKNPPSANFSSIKKLVFCYLPVFMVDPRYEETEALYRNYSQVRHQLMKFLESPRFLERVLEKYCEAKQDFTGENSQGDFID